MAYDPQDMSGVLFVNEKGKDTHPDRTGYIIIEGKKWSLAGWIKEGKRGPFLSLKASEPRVPTEEAAPAERDMSDPIPF